MGEIERGLPVLFGPITGGGEGASTNGREYKLLNELVSSGTSEGSTVMGGAGGVIFVWPGTTTFVAATWPAGLLVATGAILF